jgi:antitoxin component YwqK of YwqJK toxin-antitoxin module
MNLKEYVIKHFGPDIVKNKKKLIKSKRGKSKINIEKNRHENYLKKLRKKYFGNLHNITVREMFYDSGKIERRSWYKDGRDIKQDNYYECGKMAESFDWRDDFAKHR